MSLGSAIHAICMVFILVACSTQPVAVHPPKPPVSAPSPTALPETPSPEANTSAAQPGSEAPKSESSERQAHLAKPASPLVYEASSADYRRDAARHIYQRLPERVYKGKLPPMLKAVVVVDIHIEPSGQVGHIDWVRVPKNSPEVKQLIEQAIIQSAPFPAPSNFKRVRYTDTWLLHKSGRFQLDTLTEGQN
jgi:periplasmic protein TonB